MTDVDEIINELENELLGKKNIFGKCYVDEVKVTSLLSKLRESVPQAFYEAGYLNNGLMILPPMALIIVGALIWILNAKQNKVK